MYLSICNFPYFLTDKQKTKKVREIQIPQILIVSIAISYIFCALEFFILVEKIVKLARFARLFLVYISKLVKERNFAIL